MSMNFLSSLFSPSVDIKKRNVRELYVIGSIIGSGAYGSVYLAKDKSTGEQVAIKIMENTSDILQEVKEEFDILKSISLDCTSGIVCFRDIFVDSQNIYVIMDYIKGQNLEKLISKKRTSKEMEHNMFSLLTALNKIHSADIAHLDIKGENIIQQDNGEPVLVDFGFSCSVKKDHLRYCRGAKGSEVYLSPEMYLLFTEELKKMPEEIAYQESDVWSLGIVFLELLTSTQIEEQGFSYIRDLNINQKDPDSTVTLWELLPSLGTFPVATKGGTRKLRNIINKMLIPDYRKRFSTKELLKMF